jgi:ParB family transcriptional regulator, chromosome partitioning protein
MTELRNVDPRTLKPNPVNPRRTPAPPAMDEQLLASIKAVGLIQPPVVRVKDGELVIKAGHRRVEAAIKAELATIDVIVNDAEDAHVPMQSLSENLIRASLNSVDIWRATQALENQGWNEQAIADALALPLRTVKRLKLLAHLHPPMLDVMAHGSMPNEDQLRTVAAATPDEQAQVWKKYKPKKGHEVTWHEVARALAKRRIPFSAAKFGDDLARAYGIEWLDDLFAPAGEDGRYTTNADGFFGAQQEWLQNNLPERGRLLPQDDYGRPVLPKKAEHVHGKPGKTDQIGHYLDPTSGEVKTLAYRLPREKPEKGAKSKAHGDTAQDAPEPKSRPDVTQRGLAMIGDFRTDALHQALREGVIDDARLIALLVIALAGDNVSIHSGADMSGWDVDGVRATITEGGVLTGDRDLIRTAARAMLVGVLSCRDNMSNSGIVARIAGEAIGAAVHLPNMATEEFLSCLSRQALEATASANGARIGARVRDTRANLVSHFQGTTYRHPSAVFTPTADALKQDVEHRRFVVGLAGRGGGDGQDDGAGSDADEDGEGAGANGEEAGEADEEAGENGENAGPAAWADTDQSRAAAD